MVKELSQAEWLGMLDEHDPMTADGSCGHAVCSARIGLDGRIVSVGLCGHGAMFSFSVHIHPETAWFLGEGRREFFFAEDGTISLLTGLPDGFSVPSVRVENLSMAYPSVGIVPRDKWIADYVGVVKHKIETGSCVRDFATDSVKPVAIEVNRFRVPTAVIVESGFRGRTTEREIAPDDILCETYGLVRNNLLENWGAKVGTTKTPEAYFNNDLDLVYNADTSRFHRNNGIHGYYFGKRGVSNPTLTEAV